MKNCIDELAKDYGTSYLNEKFKQKLISIRNKKFISLYNIKKEIGYQPLLKYYGYDIKHISPELGVDIPFYTDHRKYYLDDKNQIIIKSERYTEFGEVDLTKLKELVQFCESKNWKMQIVQGIETHVIGQTLTMVFLTGYYIY